MTTEPACERQGGPPLGALQGEAILARIDALAAVSESPDHLTRRYLTPEHRAAHALVGGWMEAAGMSVRQDAVGNLVGRLEGTEPGLPALVMGSHLDTVVDAGRFDGMLGVVTAIACVQALSDAGRRLPFALEVVGFADEEGARFQSTYLGSRAIAGTFDAGLLERRDAAGTSMAEAMTAFGLDPARIGEAARRPEEILAYLELHIEQGPVLEAEGLPVGVVTAIAGATRLAITLEGAAGHAGTVPMALRRDALPGAAECLLAVERIARAAGGAAVATVGVLEAGPGAPNVIPGRVSFTVDLRAPADDARRKALASILEAVEEIARRRDLEFTWAKTHEAASVACAPWLMDQLSAAVEACGWPARRLPSGAGHDAAAMAAVADVGMLFVRCAGGVSHSPQESITAEDAAAGAAVLLKTIEAFRPAEEKKA